MKRSRDQHATAALDAAAGPDDTPSQLVSASELLLMCREALSSEELQIIELRGQNLSWQQIGQIMELSPDAVRMQLKRATQRVTEQFGLVE